MTPDKFDAKARELMESLTAINSHLGYQFTQPIMAAKENIAAALRDADQAGYKRGFKDCEEFIRKGKHEIKKDTL